MDAANPIRRPSAARATLLAAMAMAGVLGALPAAQAQGSTQPPVTQAPRNVVVLGASATVEVPQDWLTVVFAATREGADAAAVQNQLRQALDTALAEARKAARPGLVEVRTGGFSLIPRYAAQRTPGVPAGIVGWQGTAELIVEGRDTAAIAALPQRLPSMQIARLGFSLSREGREKVEAEVTEMAVQRFKARAAAVAKHFGFGSYTLREVSIDGAEPPGNPPMPMLRAQAASVMSDESLPVQAGRSAVTAVVSGSVQMQ